MYFSVNTLAKAHHMGVKDSRCRVLVSPDKRQHPVLGTVDRPRSPEVSQHHTAPGRRACHENVIWLQISMDNVLIVQV